MGCAGEAAVKFESLPDDVIVAKALSVLRSIFGDRTVPEVHLLTPISHLCYHNVPLIPSCVIMCVRILHKIT